MCVFTCAHATIHVLRSADNLQESVHCVGPGNGTQAQGSNPHRHAWMQASSSTKSPDPVLSLPLSDMLMFPECYTKLTWALKKLSHVPLTFSAFGFLIVKGGWRREAHMWNASHILMCLHTWSPASGMVFFFFNGFRALRRWSLTGGSVSLRETLETLRPCSTSCVLCFWTADTMGSPVTFASCQSLWWASPLKYNRKRTLSP